MNLKSTLKSIKLNESTISMVLGALVIIVVGLLVVNYFRNVEPGQTFPDGVATEEGNVSLPTTHKVASGETLWTISQKYYGTGYNWVDIAETNDLSRADVISEGQELTIPDVEPKGLANDEATPSEEMAMAEESESPEPSQSPTATPTIEPTQSPTQSPTPTVKATATPSPTATPASDEQMAEEDSSTEITSNTYTVEHGDTLWDIAVRAYGDGYKWVEIANANDLVNPNLIHAGNVFTLPR